MSTTSPLSQIHSLIAIPFAHQRYSYDLKVQQAGGSWRISYNAGQQMPSNNSTVFPKTSGTARADELLQNPHSVADKRRRVQKMFAAIAPSYDLNNRLHSLWMDQAWRRKAVKLAQLQPNDRVVDVACG